MEAKAKVIAFPGETVKRQKSHQKPKGWVLTPSKFLTDKEYDRLLKNVRERRDAALQRGTVTAARDCALVLLLAKSGLRIGEAIKLLWGDVHLRSADGRPPGILVRNGKGNKTRLVVIGEDLRRELKLWKQASEARNLSTGTGDHIFHSQRGGPLTVSGGERIVASAMKRAGITGKRNPHRLRHTYASRLYRATKDLRLVQKMLGHSRADTTAVYADLFCEEVKAAVDRI